MALEAILEAKTAAGSQSVNAMQHPFPLMPAAHTLHLAFRYVSLTSFPYWASDSAGQRLQRARLKGTLFFHGHSIKFLVILNTSNEFIIIHCHY